MLSNELQNNLILGILYLLKSNRGHYEHEPYMCAVYDNDNLIASALMTPPNNLIIHCEHIDDNALKIIARDIIERKIGLPGVIGISSAAEAFAHMWSFENICTSEITMNMGVFSLNHIAMPDNMPEGELLPGQRDDVEIITKWILAYEEEALHRESDSDIRSRVERMIERKILYIWKENDKPKSMAIRTRKIVNGETISGVYTPPPLRNRGYASAAVACLSRIILDSNNSYVCLFTDLSNPTSNSIYRNIGYRYICQYKEFKCI